MDTSTADVTSEYGVDVAGLLRAARNAGAGRSRWYGAHEQQHGRPRYRRSFLSPLNVLDLTLLTPRWLTFA